MSTWFVLLSILILPRADLDADGVRARPSNEVRYRGIERLLAKFEQEYEAELSSQNR